MFKILEGVRLLGYSRNIQYSLIEIHLIHLEHELYVLH